MPKKAIKQCYHFFGENLLKLRKEKNLSQQQMADELGICRSTYTKWETNVAEPSLYFIVKIAEILETDYNTLFQL